MMIRTLLYTTVLMTAVWGLSSTAVFSSKNANGWSISLNDHVLYTNQKGDELGKRFALVWDDLKTGDTIWVNHFICGAPFDLQPRLKITSETSGISHFYSTQDTGIKAGFPATDMLSEKQFPKSNDFNVQFQLVNGENINYNIYMCTISIVEQ